MRRFCEDKAPLGALKKNTILAETTKIFRRPTIRSDNIVGASVAQIKNDRTILAKALKKGQMSSDFPRTSYVQNIIVKFSHNPLRKGQTIRNKVRLCLWGPLVCNKRSHDLGPPPPSKKVRLARRICTSFYLKQWGLENLFGERASQQMCSSCSVTSAISATLDFRLESLCWLLTFK